MESYRYYWNPCPSELQVCHLPDYLQLLYCYWYDLDKHELHGMRSDYNLNAFHEATLFGGDSILITGESEIKKYKKQDFSVKCKLLTPNILR